MSSSTTPWPLYRLLLFRAFLPGVILFIISFPFGYQVLPEPGRYLHHLFEVLVRGSAEYIFHIRRPYVAELISDSTGFYINAFNILILSIIISITWTIVFKQVRSHNKLLYWFTAFVRYYLALQLFIYGVNKVFKVQFYLPEPNILFTKLGYVPKDLLYWSSMGISRPYCVFLGTLEVIAAILLLFRRTMLAGALFSFFLLLNILAINLAFDISVKLLSCFLLLLSVYLLLIRSKRVQQFLSDRSVSVKDPVYPRLPAWYSIIKAAVILLLLLECTWPYIRTGNFNDDAVPRPYLHGAYNVESFIINNDTLPPLLTDNTRWKRVFFHRDGYIIIEKMNDEMGDYRFGYDSVKQEIVMQTAGSPTVLSYKKDGTSLLLEGSAGLQHYKIVLQQQDWRKLPLLRKEFSWTVD